MKRIAIILAAVLGLSGCATTLTTIPPDHTLGPRDESVVIGRLTLDLMQPPLAFFANLGRMKLTVTNETTGKDYAVFCDKTGLDSEFYVPLPPGRYRFVSVHAMNAVSQLPPGRFDVESGHVQYVGTIRFRGTSIVGGGRWHVEDESETTVKAFRERYPRITQPVAKPAPEAWGSIGPGSWRILRPQ
jgi:hypothetical protein